MSEVKINDYVLVSDVDGVVTSTYVYYNQEGKYLKAFGPDDTDLLKLLSKHIEVHFITADNKGFPIVKKRLNEELGFNLSLVNNMPQKRFQWIQENYPNKNVFFIGDGWADFYCIEKCYYGICLNDSLEHVKEKAKYITKRTGGNRGLAEAVLHVAKLLEIDLINEAM